MKNKIGQRLVKSLKPKEKPYEVRDPELKGFLVRVQPSGVMSYVLEYQRGKRMTLGRVGVITPAQARDEAKKRASQKTLDLDPLKERENERESSFRTTLGDFLEEEYRPYCEEHHRNSRETLRKIKVSFAELLPIPLSELTPFDIEKARRKLKVAKSSRDRELSALRGLLSYASNHGFIETNPASKIKNFTTIRTQRKRVRFLDEDEEARLRGALDARQEEAREGRARANRWRLERGYRLLPNLRQITFTDRLKPIVLLALNTGMRRGEIFDLKWVNVDLKRGFITLEVTKNQEDRTIPLNKEAFEVLLKWQNQSGRSNSYVFPADDGGRLNNINNSWRNLMTRASIKDFRFHDLRHDFDVGFPHMPRPGHSDPIYVNRIEDRINKLTLAFAEGNFGALAEVVHLCVENEIPLPEWAGCALMEVLNSAIWGRPLFGKGRHGRWITKYKEAMTDLERFHLVELLSEQGVPRIDVWDVASMILQGTFAKGGEDAIKKAYYRHKKRPPAHREILGWFQKLVPAPNEKAAARYIGMSIPFLRQSRMNGKREHRTPGPPFIKIGRSVRYLVKDLDTWLEAHRIER